MVNPKAQTLSQEQKEELKTIVTADSFEAEIEPRKRKASYDFEEIVTALKGGKMVKLPLAVKTENTMYQLRKALREIKGLENADFAKLKGSARTEKNRKKEDITVYQYFVFVPKKA